MPSSRREKGEFPSPARRLPAQGQGQSHTRFVASTSAPRSSRSKQCHTGSIYFLRPHTYRFGAGRSALREQCLQTVFSAQQQCHFDNFRYFDVFGDNFVLSLVFPLCFLCFVSFTVSKLLQRKYKGKTRDMTKLSLKASNYRKLSRWHRC